MKQMTELFMSKPSLLLAVWLLLLSLILFFCMGADKRKARLHRFRIPEKTLFLLALLGGAPGGTAGMYLFHHKTKHWYFALFFPLLALLQTAICVYLCIKC